MQIKYKKLSDSAIIPTRGSDDAAGCDLYAPKGGSWVIPPHATVKVGINLAFEIPRGTFAAIFARSGLATKHGLRPANCVGVCDADYRGEYIVALHNDSDESYTVQGGDRIAQIVILPFLSIDEFVPADELTETERGDGGFGHSGK